MNASVTTTPHGLQMNNTYSNAVLPNVAGANQPMDVIKVSANSRSTAVAGAIAGVVRDHGHAEVQAIGASAVNQAVKAIAIANGYLEMDEIQIVCVPSFTEVVHRRPGTNSRPYLGLQALDRRVEWRATTRSRRQICSV